MKKTFLLFLSLGLFTACNNTANPSEDQKSATIDETQKIDEPQQEISYFGDTITEEGSANATELLAMMDNKDSMQVKVSGKINSSCQKKGCWMKMDLGNDKEMHVKFKDYGFFVPKNLNGETAVLEGYAKVDTIGVDHLRHLASDAGKSEEEINAITEPEVTLTYVANGVIIKG